MFFSHKTGALDSKNKELHKRLKLQVKIMWFLGAVSDVWFGKYLQIFFSNF